MNKILLMSGLLSCCSVYAQSIRWPHHKKALIVLTYDDALISQLDTAIPQLKHAGFKATFFLTSDIDNLTIPRWRALGKNGFELAMLNYLKKNKKIFWVATFQQAMDYVMKHRNPA